MYDAWDHYFLRNKGINATVGVVGVNEFVNANIGRNQANRPNYSHDY